MRVPQFFNELSSRNKFFLVGGVALVFVIIFSLVVSSLGAQQQARSEDSLYRTAQSALDRSTTTTPLTEDEIARNNAEADELFNSHTHHDHGTEDQHDHIQHPDVDRAPSGYIEPSNLARYYPRIPGDMTDATYEQANATMLDVTRARKTNEGRDRYPEFFAHTGPSEAVIVDFTPVYANTTSVPGYRGLYRTVVVWRGSDNFGLRFSQVRTAMYSTAQENGTFKPMRISDIPPKIAREDAMINGVSVTA